MTNRLKLLAAVAAIALPAGLASAQSAAPGGGAARPTTGAVPPPVQTPSTANTATEDAQAATEATTTAPTGQPPAAQPAATAQASTQAQAAATTPPVRLATAADLRTGVQVRDQNGALVGTVESADATGAVVSTGTVRARLALASFGANGQALVISMTRAQLEAAATHAAPRPSAG